MVVLSTALNAATALVNRYLQLDPAAWSRARHLSNKVVHIEVVGFTLTIYIVIHEQRVEFTTQAMSTDVSVRGTPLALLSLLKTRHAIRLIQNKTLAIQGDIHVLQQLQQLFAELDIDWEEYAADYLGDVAAYNIFQTGRRLTRWGLAAGKSLRQNLSEYLQEELRYFPPRAEVEDFYQAVNVVRDDTERLSLRVERLQKIFNRES